MKQLHTNGQFIRIEQNAPPVPKCGQFSGSGIRLPNSVCPITENQIGSMNYHHRWASKTFAGTSFAQTYHTTFIS